ncbi:MAG: hypothetical protein SAL07_11625 [Oscillatoria sp. PMC 1051.18]|nr:hypothetical protein [Oscillatoria sp. PMC 1050.18]MEC5030557.1 hypothetical protein [Oscillatoria sp. PMC 1051.18]
MSEWAWLSRVALVGVAGTVAIAIKFSPLLPEKSSNDSAKNINSPQTKVLPVKLLETPPQLPQAQPTNSPTQTAKATSEFNLDRSLEVHSPLFATPISLGMLAIGVAEGNYRLFIEDNTLYVEQTKHYFGHTDPGNLSWGDVVTNYGPCSDQGRSRGNISQAEAICLQRSRSQLATHLTDLHQAGINPDLDLEAVINVADLYNQASPIHSRRFPEALAIARGGGLTGVKAIAWARTASFYLNANNELDVENGSNHATGLLGVCIRENLVITEWNCVYRDQLRRAEAIASVINKYIQIAKQQKNQVTSSD